MKINIKNKIIGEGRVYVIAEIGNNHNGSLDRAIALVDASLEVGADSAKFQMRNLSEVYRKKSLDFSGDDLSTEYTVDLLRKFELSLNDHKKLFDYCNFKGIEYLCTPWDSLSLRNLEEFGVSAYKVSSADLTNTPLIKELIKTNKPLILSTGMSLIEEVQHTVDLLKKNEAQFILLHCNSTYPAPLQDINIRWINKLKKMHPYIGYSGHERGINVSLATISLNVCLIERHITLDRNMEGPDHAASLTPLEFKDLVIGIREIELALGDGENRELSQGEMINRENLSKSLVASSDINKGEIITQEKIKIRSPGQGLNPQQQEKLLGIKINRNMSAEDFFYESDINKLLHTPRHYSFARPWGIPVRYHDFDKFNQLIQPDLWEFHFSYSDMKLDPNEFLKKKYSNDFVVHAPELFGGSHLMDLTTNNEEYRAESIIKTQKIIDITKKMKEFFPKTVRPLIVANVGGFTMDKPLLANVIQGYYERFGDSLSRLDLDGIELIPQTMAPFPWHFGGQRFQNIFINKEEILKWCKILNIRICLDVSHSFLSCNYFEEDFYEYCQVLGPYVAHLHLGDAKKLNGEGLQIGEGMIDFIRLGKILDEYSPRISFIPEIWQGHKDNGEGFWIALEKLESIL